MAKLPENIMSENNSENASANTASANTTKAAAGASAAKAADTAGGAKAADATAAGAAASPKKAEAKTPPPKPKARGKGLYFGLSLVAAGLSGGIIALLGGAVLMRGDFHPPAGAAAEQSAHAPASWTAEKQALRAELAQNIGQIAQAARAAEAQSADMEGKLRALTEQSAARQSPANAAPDYAALKAELDSLNQKQRKQEQAQNSAIAGLAAAQARDNREILAKLAALGEKVAVLYDKRKNAQNELARLAALQNFRSAFDGGAPYAAELQVFNAAFPHSWSKAAAESDGAEAALSANLARFADSGLPNQAQLAAGFTPLADKLAAKGGGAGKAGGGFLAAIKGYFSSWISIRPQGAPQGASLGAGLARMEAALRQGDDGAALRQAESLPPEAQKELQNYTEILRLRLAAQAVFRQAAQSVFSPELMPQSAPAGAAISGRAP